MGRSQNIEIKARTEDHDTLSRCLAGMNADFRGIDNQVDTYFNVRDGRLKIREGNVENCIVFYTRETTSSPRKCDYSLVPFDLSQVDILRNLKNLLTASYGLRVVVKKKREIYYIGNVKFHLDSVEGLGMFVEIEAGATEDMGPDDLHRQCNHFMEVLGIGAGDCIGESYSDMLLTP